MVLQNEMPVRHTKETNKKKKKKKKHVSFAAYCDMHLRECEVSQG